MVVRVRSHTGAASEESPPLLEFWTARLLQSIAFVGETTGLVPAWARALPGGVMSLQVNQGMLEDWACCLSWNIPSSATVP